MAGFIGRSTWMDDGGLVVETPDGIRIELTPEEIAAKPGGRSLVDLVDAKLQVARAKEREMCGDQDRNRQIPEWIKEKIGVPILRGHTWHAGGLWCTVCGISQVAIQAGQEDPGCAVPDGLCSGCGKVFEDIRENPVGPCHYKPPKVSQEKGWEPSEFCGKINTYRLRLADGRVSHVFRSMDEWDPRKLNFRDPKEYEEKAYADEHIITDDLVNEKTELTGWDLGKLEEQARKMGLVPPSWEEYALRCYESLKKTKTICADASDKESRAPMGFDQFQREMDAEARYSKLDALDPPDPCDWCEYEQRTRGRRCPNHR